jgi:hypothetical protein
LKQIKKLKFENFLGLASQPNTMPTFKKKQKHIQRSKEKKLQNCQMFFKEYLKRKIKHDLINLK